MDPIVVLRDFYKGNEPLVVSPKGTFLVCAYSEEVNIIGLRKSNILGRVSVLGDKVTAIAISPDEDTFITISQKKKVGDTGGQNLVIYETWKIPADWESSDPKRINKWPGGHINPVCAIDIFKQRDGELLVSSGKIDGKIYVRTYDGKYQYDFKENEHEDQITCIRFYDKNDKLYIIASSIDVRIWSYRTRKCLAKLEEHKGIVSTFSISSDGDKLFTCGSDKIVVWDMSSIEEIKLVRSIWTEEPSVALGTIVPKTLFANYIDSLNSYRPADSLFVSLSKEGKVFVCDSKTDQPLFTLTCPVQDKKFTGLAMINYGFEGLLFKTDNYQLLICEGGDNKSLNLRLKKRIMGLSGPIKDLKFWDIMDKKCLVVATGYEHIRIYDLESMSCRSHATFAELTEQISSFDTCKSNNGKSLIVTASNYSVRLFEITNQQFVEVGFSEVNWEAFTSVAFSKKFHNFFVSGRDDFIFHLWKFDSENLEEGSKLSPIILYKEKFERGVIKGSITSVAVSHDDKFLCFGGRYKVYLWKWTNPSDPIPKMSKALEGHWGEVRSVSFSVDVDGKQLLLSASEDMAVRVWDVSKETCLHRLMFTSTVQRALYIRLNDVPHVVCVCDDGVQLWKVETDEYTALSEANLNQFKYDPKIKLSLDFDNESSSVVATTLSLKSIYKWKI